jgi:hypothetical protein
MRWLRRAQRAPDRVAVQAAVFPGVEQTSTLDVAEGLSSTGLMALVYWPRFPRPPIAVGKKLSSRRGGRGANLKHRARDAGQPAESRFTTQFASGSRGPVARGSYGARRSARPSLLGHRQMGLRRTRRRKEYGCKSASTRVFNQHEHATKKSAHSRTRVRASRGPSTGSSGNPALWRHDVRPLGPRFRGDERKHQRTIE